MSTIPSAYQSMGMVMRSAFAMIVQMGGNTDVTYQMAMRSGSDDYGNPVVSYSSTTITAIVQPVDEKEVNFMEPGLNPQNYAKIYFSHPDIVPTTQDRFTWNSIQFEIRYAYPTSFADNIVYYKVVGCRLYPI